MNWTSPEALRAQLRKLWDSGRMLASLAENTELFPRRLSLVRPTSAEMVDRFAEVRDWIGRLRQQEGNYRLVWRTVNHRTLGTNRVPQEVWVDTFEDALTMIDRQEEAGKFLELVTVTAAQEPGLMPWLIRRPLQGLALADDWHRLLAIVSWVKRNPRPGVYLRQIDIGGVDSKFIESHRRVLAELFDLVLPEDHVDESYRGITGFCRRYGFEDKPVRVRFRLLDPSIRLIPGDAGQDIAVTGDGFAGLDLSLTDVFITENEINFLTFPGRPRSMVVFGSGYGFDTLGRAQWLRNRRICYWGDIDTHGFAILDQLRAHFPQAVSFLMDRQTLLDHRQFWDLEPQPFRGDLTRLTADERELFDDLRTNRFGESVRLEQERISFSRVVEEVQRV